MTRSFFHHVLEKVASLAPGRVGSALDRLRPELATDLGGPFNGQTQRVKIVSDILARVAFDLVVETGTYRGATTAFLREKTTCPIVTIERSSRFYHYARRQLSGLSGVVPVRGDSPTEIRRIASAPHRHSQLPFFYLDAHWGSHLPIRCELIEILAGWTSFCAVIDDFAVPGDPGYRYEDWGPGFRMDSSVLKGLPLGEAQLFWPDIPSSLETGHRRGWLVMGRGEGVVAALRSTVALRHDQTAAWA